MRLDKYLNDALSLTRSKSIKIIKDKEVLINGKICTKKDYDVKNDDIVTYKGTSVKLKGEIYLMMNKGKGIVCSKEERDGTPIYDYISEKSVNPIGRLDKDTTGLILLTSNGNLIHKITSPKSHIEKEYEVNVKEELNDKVIEDLKQERVLTNGKRGEYKAIPIDVKMIDSHSLSIVISEGKYHEIKEIVSSCNLTLVDLKRVRIGNIYLDSILGENEIRYLNEEEIKYLLNC